MNDFLQLRQFSHHNGLILRNTWELLEAVIFAWINTPRLVMLTILILFGATFILQRSRYKRYLRILLLTGFGLYLSLNASLTASILVKGLTLWLPDEIDQKVDAIVVLSRGKEVDHYSRYDLAISLWKEHRAPQIFVTAASRAGYMTKRFRQNGWPLSALSGSSCAGTTYEEAMSTAALLQPSGVRKIVLVTDAPHMLRSSMVFRALGFQVQSESVMLSSDFPAIRQSLLALREYMGLIKYLVLGRFQERSLTAASRTDAFAKVAVGFSHCQISWLKSN